MNTGEQVKSKDVNDLKNIVVIGNGFDMGLGLKSSYQDFIEYIKVRHRFSSDIELYNYNRLFLRKYENFSFNWSDFESLYEDTIRKINNRSEKSEEPQDIFDITSINDSIKRLEEDFQEYLLDEYSRWSEQKMVPIGNTGFKRFTVDVNPFFKTMVENKNTSFINFNYTNTIGDLCESVLYDTVNIAESSSDVKKAKERVYHIHGSLEEENILFGGGFTDSEDISQIHYSQSLINDKLFRIKENERLNSTRTSMMSTLGLNNEAQDFVLYIIGHSLRGSDFSFLSKLIKQANKVFIFYYEDDYTLKMEEILRKLGSSVAEKIVLVPFLEILMEDELIVSTYKQYEDIAPFVSNKFPKEDMLSSLTLTKSHFIFRSINELRISTENIKQIIQISESLVLGKNASRITRIYFEETMVSTNFKELNNSGDFLRLLKWVEKVVFFDTEIDSNFFARLLEYGSNLSYIRMEYCTFVNESAMSADISICESLRRLEILDCSFTITSSETKKGVFNIESESQNNIEKLTVLRNTSLVIGKSVLENSSSLKDLNILITDENVYQEETHLEKLETLQIDHSYGLIPNITVGNKVKEIIVIGYSDKYLRLSSIMRNSEGQSVGFPKLKLFQLKTPDQMTSCHNLIVDVILDVFSNDTKFIVDKDIKSIKEYYLEDKEPQTQIFNYSGGLIDDSILAKVKDLFFRVSNLTNQSIIEEFLEEMNTNLDVKTQTINQTELDIEQKELNGSNGSNRTNENDSVSKSKSNKKDYVYTLIDNLLYDYCIGNIPTSEDLFNALEQENNAEIVMGIYHEIDKVFSNANDHVKYNSKKDVQDLKIKLFVQARDKVIRDFSEKWFVSEDELGLSAIQYVLGIHEIPNIRGIINSIKYESYKAKHQGTNPIKYTQAMKRDWKRVLEEKVVWLNEELKRTSNLDGNNNYTDNPPKNVERTKNHSGKSLVTS